MQCRSLATQLHTRLLRQHCQAAWRTSIHLAQAGARLPAGSQDKSIKQWSGNHAHTTYNGHTDSVRGLCNLPGVGFVSAANDMTLRVWTLTGDTVAELVGHTALVYSCAATSDGLIVSGAPVYWPYVLKMQNKLRSACSTLQAFALVELAECGGVAS